MYDGKTIWFVIRGIAGHPSDQLEWEYEGRDILILTTGRPAVAVSYATTFLTVWNRRHWRARQFARVLRKFTARDYRVHILAHSEGTVVAVDSMKLAGWPRVESVHLVCGACDSDFHRNGLNEAVRTGCIGRVHCYMAGEDEAMWWENLDLGKILFGIPLRSRSLGLKGPRNVDDAVRSQIIEHRDAPWDNYDHSTCWETGKIEATLLQVMANAHA